MSDHLTLTLADERARIYREGGIGYDQYIPSVGWAVNDSGPTHAFEDIADAARTAFLQSDPHTIAEINL